MAGMNMFDMIQSAAGGQAVNEVAGKFGLSDAQAQMALKALLPAISGGLKRNAAQPQGLQGLMGALQKGSHERYLDNPEALTQPETVEDGNAILGHLLGSKDMSRQVASHAAQKTGISDSILKQMLPIVAAMAMGSLSKQSKKPEISDLLMGALAGQMGGQKSGGGGLAGMVGSMLGGRLGKAPAQPQQAGGVNLGMLGGLLDADGDGNAMDDILNMVMKR